MKIFCAVALAVLTATPALADPVTLDFEGAAGYVNSIGDYYNGGTDSAGQSGPNYGVSFSEAAVALSNDEFFQYYSNAPSPLTVMFAFDSTALMNVASGFAGFLSFAYSSSEAVSDAVSIYSGLNGTGTLLASVSLLGNAQNNCADTAFCHFDVASVAFSGLARSVSFAGNAPNVVYDDVTLAPVPEPSTYLLLSMGLIVGAVAKRRSARQGA